MVYEAGEQGITAKAGRQCAMIAGSLPGVVSCSEVTSAGDDGWCGRSGGALVTESGRQQQKDTMSSWLAVLRFGLEEERICCCLMGLHVFEYT